MTTIDNTEKKRFPPWIRRAWPSGPEVGFTKEVLQDLRLATVCQGARCPNRGECWGHRTATFMILGNTCTRHCAFCSVPSGRPEGPPDPSEPERVAEAVSRLGLRHVVVTSVTRDDLPDGGARQFAQLIAAVRARNPGTTVEVLTPDFAGSEEAIGMVMDARPEVFGHNIETVRALYPTLRGREYSYGRALQVLRTATMAGSATIIKSGFMVGHGETEDDVRTTLTDLRGAGCEAVTIGQYLKPDAKSRDVAEYLPPERFGTYEEEAYGLGFSFVVAGPFVRSSYRAEEMMRTCFARGRLRSRLEADGTPGPITGAVSEIKGGEKE